MYFRAAARIHSITRDLADGQTDDREIAGVMQLSWEQQLTTQQPLDSKRFDEPDGFLAYIKARKKLGITVTVK
jgi:hypothetical protein